MSYLCQEGQECSGGVPWGAPWDFGLIRTMAAPAPNLVGQVLPHSTQSEIDSLPARPSVVPVWSQDSIRSTSFSQITVRLTPSSDLGPDGWGRLYASTAVSEADPY
jgi:hypothetical protein